MGPCEAAAVRLVAACVWPGNPVSVALARALVLQARKVDSAPEVGGLGRAELDGLTGLLRSCPAAASPLWELRARAATRRARAEF